MLYAAIKNNNNNKKITKKKQRKTKQNDHTISMGGSRGATGGPYPHPHWKITRGYRFPYGNTFTDPHREAIDPRGPIASRWRFIRPFVKYDDD